MCRYTNINNMWPCVTLRGALTRHGCPIPFQKVWGRVCGGVWGGYGAG